MGMRSTTVLAILRDGHVVVGADGQATMGETIMKHNVRKVRPLHDGKVLAGFAGSTADSFTLFERFEAKLQQYGGNLMRGAVELAKDWRTDRFLRRLEALMIVASPERILLISGDGNVIEPEDNVAAIGSGGPYALAAARALLRYGAGLTTREIVERSLHIAAEICIYTNDNLSIMEIEGESTEA